ncbi:MAG: hypothetical protein FJ100_14935 [Deltaproteobacteria bacterium]|nr:hypothetical protein [Deltaproteobacteria bacterium]
MFEVTLSAIAKGSAERVERVVHKHSGGALDHVARVALLADVQAGRPRVVARYHERHCADNALAELCLLRATASVSAAQAAA